MFVGVNILSVRNPIRRRGWLVMRFKPAWIFCTGGRERRRKQAHRERQFGGIGAQNACFLVCAGAFY
jgi:hypothetical protein